MTIRRQLRTSSFEQLAQDREALRADLLQQGAQPQVASYLARIVCELATNGAAHGSAEIVEVEAPSLTQVWVRIPGEAFDSVQASSRGTASGLADAEHLVRQLGWRWDWSWEDVDRLSGLARSEKVVEPTFQAQRNVIRLWLCPEEK
jgi:hypothetical protein